MTDDWRWFLFQWEVARTTVLGFGELPGWNPYHCGGHVQWANPQTQEASPLLWLSALAAAPWGGGVGAALLIFTAVHACLGAASMAALARTLGLRGAPAALATITWTLCGFFAWHVGGGHVAFQPLWYAPAALAALLRGRPILAGGVVGLMVLEGGAYPAAFTALLLGLHGWRRTPHLAAAALVGALVGGAKLLPAAAFLAGTPRATELVDALSFGEAATMFLSRRQATRFGDHPFVWPEYGSYVGPVVLCLAAASALGGGWRRLLRWWVGAGVFGALMLGDHGPASPYALLHRLPPFDATRVPSRFAALVTLHLAVLAGFGLAELAGRIRRPRRAAAALSAAAVLGVGVDLGWLAGRHAEGLPRVGTAATAPPAPGFRMTDAPWRDAAALPRLGRGTRACYEPHRLPAGQVRTGLPSEVHAAAGARGEIRVVGWSPNRVDVEGRLDAPGLIVLNQNDHAGWRVGGARASSGGMPAVRMPAGPFRTSFTYAPPGLLVGLVGSLLGLGVVGWSAWRSCGRRPRRPVRP